MKGYIYKLLHEDGRFYIGSTKDDITIRFKKHIANKLIKDFNDCWDKVIIECLEEVEHSIKKELQEREQFYIDTLRNEKCLNKIRACRRSRSQEHQILYQKIKGTDKDFYAKHREKNREKNKEYSRQYYQKNKEKILIKMKEEYERKRANQ